MKILTSVAIEPTNHCNFDCVMCYRGERERGYMSWKTFIEVMYQIKKIRTINLIGLNFAGEPLLHPNFLEMINYINSQKDFRIVLQSHFPFVALKRGYSIAFTTNGSLLMPEKFDALNGKVDRIQISIDGSKEDTEKQRVGSSYDTIKRNALYAIFHKMPNTKIAIHATKTTQTQESLKKFKSDWQNADEVTIIDAHNENLVRSSRLPQLSLYCHELNHYLVVLWNGDITTCCGDLAGRNICGNLFNGGISKGTKPGSLCKECNIYR